MRPRLDEPVARVAWPRCQALPPSQSPTFAARNGCPSLPNIEPQTIARRRRPASPAPASSRPTRPNNLWQDNSAVFVDVLPRAPRPANLPPGTIWRDRPRRDIPGSIWLPDTGYGALAPITEDYLRKNLERVTGGDRAKLLVVYCLRDCWMSWNAAKRILSMGYVNVAWYPEGTDGWTDAFLPVIEAQPAPTGD